MIRVVLLLLGSVCTMALADPVDVTCNPKTVDFAFKFFVTNMWVDQDQDGDITGKEFAFMALSRYDANNDGVWTEQECVYQHVCGLGDTTLMAQFSCELLFRDLNIMGVPITDGKIDIDDLIASYHETSTKDYIDFQRKGYEEFANRKCLNKCLQREEKLNLMVRYVDLDKNGKITNEDVKEMLTSIDMNNDGLVTENEYADGWVCRYGDSHAFVKFAWKDMGYGPPGIIINDVEKSPIPVRKFKALHRDRYVRYEQANGPVTPNCEDVVTNCTQQGLSPNKKVAIHQKFIDVNPRDGFLSEAEVAADLSKHWDINGDGVLNERECVRGTECRYGDITNAATYVCGILLGYRDSKSLSVMAKELSGPMKDLKDFIIRVNKNFPTDKCVKRCYSDEEKVDLEMIDMDQDGDGQITKDEASNFLPIPDEHKDKEKLKKLAFVQKLICKYGASIAQANFRWTLFSAIMKDPDFFPAPEADYYNMVLTDYKEFIDTFPNAALDRPCTELEKDNGGGGSSSEESSEEDD